jgi:hypothetical protein
MSFRQAQGDIRKTFNNVFPATNNRNHPVTLSLSKSMVISTNNKQPTTNNRNRQAIPNPPTKTSISMFYNFYGNI